MGSVLIDGTRIKHAKDIIRNKLIRNGEVFLEVIRDLSRLQDLHVWAYISQASSLINQVYAIMAESLLEALCTKMFLKTFNDPFNNKFLKMEKFNNLPHILIHLRAILEHNQNKKP